MFWQVFLQNRLPTCALAFKYEIYPFSLCLSVELSQFVFTAMHPFALAYQLIRRHMALRTLYLCPSPKQPAKPPRHSILTAHRLTCVWAWKEHTVPRNRLMSSLSKCTKVIGQDIRKPANPIEACLITHTSVLKLQGKLFYLDCRTCIPDWTMDCTHAFGFS